MAQSIWFRKEGKEPVVIDRAGGPVEAQSIADAYAHLFNCKPGQSRHGKDKVWAGALKKEPKT